MSTSDGSVLGVTKIVDHGANATHWNLVILGDGYRASEMDKYHDDARAVVNALYATSPFNEVWCGVNVHRVDVTSTDSGADEPAACGGPGTTPATYFDSTFCTDEVERLLTCNQITALNVATAQVPEMHQTIVIVNSSKYGGAGGTVAVASTDASATELAIHEIGHSAFGLADEYPYYFGCAIDDDRDNYLGGEPVEPNVTIDTDRNTVKWGTFVDAATPMPTQENPDCSLCPSAPSPVAAGTVGTFEGAYYYHCDVYRPEFNCKMQNLGVPFCVVCSEAIRNTLSAYITPTTVTLTTPSIAFTDIPEGIGGTGITTYRAIVFEVAGCETRTFEIIAGPTGGFGTPLGTSDTVPPSETTPVDYGRIWLSYTSTNASDNASGEVTVECLETGQTWVININANTVARKKAAIALVLDRSGSMSDDPGDNTTKMEKLQQAATSLVEVMLDGDGLGIVQFSTSALRLMDVTDVGVAGSAARTTALNHIDGLTPGGATAIGDGILKGRQALDDAQAVAVPPYDVLAMLVLTDGMENVPPYIADVAASLNAHTFAVGFGLPENLDVAKLDALTSNTGGYLVVTGAITPDQSHRLTKYFLQILADIENAFVVLDPSGELSYGAEHRIPFQLSGADYGADVILLTPLPGHVEFELETPFGERIAPSSLTANTRYVDGERTTYYRVGLPAIPGAPEKSHAGEWSAILRFARKPNADRKSRDSLARAELDRISRTKSVPYDVIVHAYSNLTFRASIAKSTVRPGAQITLNATLAQYTMPLTERAKVWADVVWPDGSTRLLQFTESLPGTYTAQFTGTAAGLYRARIRATGTTLEGDPFTREQTLTAALVTGRAGSFDPPTTTPSGHSNCCCELLRCLFSEKVMSDKFRREWRDRGLDLGALQKCIEHACKEHNEGTSATIKSRERLDPKELRKLVKKLLG